MSIVLVLLGTLFLLFLSVTIILLLIGPTLLLKPRRRDAGFYRHLGLPTSPAEMKLRYEEINIHTEEGLKLNSWLIRPPDTAKGTVIYLHGVADCKIDGLRLAKSLVDHHYNVFLYDSRRHGESDGEYCTYGFFEKFDVVSVLDYLKSRSDLRSAPIGIFGTSMGGAVALQAAAIDARIRAVIAENCFATLRSIFDDYQKRMIKLPFHYLRNLVIKRSELMAKFQANAVSPLEAIRNIRIPVMIIYGEKDPLIKSDYSRLLIEAAQGPKEVFPIPEAAHNDTWQVAGKVYEEKIIKFLNDSLT